MKNSMVMFIFSAFCWEYLLLEKFEYVEFDGVFHFFFFFCRSEIPFLDKYSLKTQNCQFKLKFDTYANSNLQNSIVNSLFLSSTGNTFFGKTWSKKSKLSV